MAAKSDLLKLPVTGNHLYYGDNLDILPAHIPDECADMIYLDPPFNSAANYNVLFKSPTGEHSQAQIEAFEDTWHWNDHAEAAFDLVMTSGNTRVAEMLRSLRAFLGENDMSAYITMMSVRMLHLYRALKPTGSLFRHCDTTASHYLKIMLDSVFGPKSSGGRCRWWTPSRSAARRRAPTAASTVSSTSSRTGRRRRRS